MRCFPFFDDCFKRRSDFLPVEWEPAQFGADSLFFEFGRAPDERGADCADKGRGPFAGEEQRSENEQDPQSHDVGPPQVAEITLAVNDPDEAEADDEEGGETEEEAEGVHSVQCSVGSRGYSAKVLVGLGQVGRLACQAA